MPGHWIPLRKNLINEVEVLAIAAETGRSVYEVLGILAHFWGWADEVTADGTLRLINVPQLSQVCPGTDRQFWESVVRVGWLRLTANGMEVPNYDRWLSRAAKKRAYDARRKRHYRQDYAAASHTKRDKRGTSSGTKSGAQTQTQTHKKKTPLPPSLDTPAFAEMWERWLQHLKEKRKTPTPSARTAQLTQLAEWGEEKAIQALREAIRGGWQSFWEPKAAPGHRVGSDMRPRPEPGKYANVGKRPRDLAAQGLSPPAVAAGEAPDGGSDTPLGAAGDPPGNPG